MPRLLVCIVLVAALALPGCAQEDATPAAAHARPDARLAPLSDGLSAAAPGEFAVAWDSGEAVGDLGAILELRIAEPAACSFRATLASLPPPATGPFQLFAAQLKGKGSDRFVAWSGLHRSAELHAVGLADTRSEVADHDGVSVMAIGFGAQAVVGDVVLTLAVRGLAPHDGDAGRVPGASMTVACDKPANVIRFARGDDVILFDQASLQGGAMVRVSEPLEASATAADGWAHRFESDEVRLLADTAIAAGALHLSHPDGEVAFPMTSLDAVDWTGGPGDYAVRLERAAAGTVDAFVGVAIGVHSEAWPSAGPA